MSFDNVSLILRDGREYRYLLQADLSLKQRTVAFLSSLHAQGFGQCQDATLISIAPSAHEDYRLVESDDHADYATHPRVVTDSTDDELSQDEDHVPSDTLSQAVPSWLATPPKGIARDTWHPESLIAQSQAAQALLTHSLEMAVTLKQWRKKLEKSAKQLPVWQHWCADIKGIDAFGLARIIAETADLWHYPTVAKVWKRMGVGLWNGERQRRKAGVTEDEARDIGYVPRRRAIIFNMQESLVKQNKACVGHNQNKCQEHPGYYRSLYLERKVYEAAKAPDEKKIVWHKRAGRYMAKRFLCHLWCAWRETMPQPSVMLAA